MEAVIDQAYHPLPRGIRVGIVAQRMACPGGIQTCLSELVRGLNREGVIPDILWDRPPHAETLAAAGARAGFSPCKLGIPSALLLLLPDSLQRPLSWWSFRHAKLDCEAYQFIYSFVPMIPMKPYPPNLCYLIGPGFVPAVEQHLLNNRPFLRRVAQRFISPQLLPSRWNRYVTLSQWIADLFYNRFGYRIPVIWPPARDRAIVSEGQTLNREGLLFLSRIRQGKQPEVMLGVARCFPDQRVTIAGSVVREAHRYVADLQRRIDGENLTNVTIVQNPSDEMISDLFAEHNVFVFPTAYEHFGIVTVEAIRAGLVPLVHDSGGQREIVPIEALRFQDESELLQRIERVLRFTARERSEMVSLLSKNVERGAPEYYQKEMLRFLHESVAES